MNSIQSNITAQNHITAVIQAIRGLTGSGRHLIVVEGDDDRNFYRQFLDDTSTQLFVEGTCLYYNDIAAACNGKYRLRYSMIKDADFDRLTGSMPIYDNILLTDYHDAEMFLTAVDIPASIFSNYQCTIALGSILTDIYCLSMTKWYNMANACKLRFRKKCTIAKLYDGHSSITFSSCLTQLAADSKNVGKATIQQQNLETFSQTNASADWRHYSNGHDLLHAIATKINRIKNKAYSELDIRIVLEASYSLTMFQATALYAGLRQREKVVGCSICK